MGVGAVHDRHVGVGDALFGVQARDFGGHPLGLLLGVVRRVADDRLALAERGPQFLGLAALVVADHRVGRIQNGLRRTIVLFEHDGLGVREVLLEVLNVADVGTTERVDGLVGIAHHGDPGGAGLAGVRRARDGLLPRVHAGQLAHEHVLGVVGVLILVDENVTEALMVVLGDGRVGARQLDRAADQIVEVDGVGQGQAMLVFGVDHRVDGFKVAHRAELVAALAGREVGRVNGEVFLPTGQIVLEATGPISEPSLSRISAAALLVKVMARIWLGHAPNWLRIHAMRRVRTRVLPEPAPAPISSAWPRYCTASACCGFRSPTSSCALRAMTSGSSYTVASL